MTERKYKNKKNKQSLHLFGLSILTCLDNTNSLPFKNFDVIVVNSL